MNPLLTGVSAINPYLLYKFKHRSPEKTLRPPGATSLFMRAFISLALPASIRHGSPSAGDGCPSAEYAPS